MFADHLARGSVVADGLDDAHVFERKQAVLLILPSVCQRTSPPMHVDMKLLNGRVRTLVAQVRAQKDQRRTSAKDDGVPAVLQGLTQLVQAEIVRAKILEKGAKVTGDCETCLDTKRLRTAKVLGKGYFGTVFDLGASALKVERIWPHVINDTLQSGSTAKRMGAIGVGPKVRSWRVCDCPGAMYYLLEMDKLRGVTLGDFLRGGASEKAKAATLSLLRAKVRRMNKAGVVHADLHGENVMVDRKGVPWVIDFAFVQGKHRDNQDDIANMVRSPNLNSDDVTPGEIIALLIAEGTVSVANPDVKVDMKFGNKEDMMA